MKPLALLALITLAASAQEPPPGCDIPEPDWKFAYTRQPRLTEPCSELDQAKDPRCRTGDPVRDMDNWLRWYDGGAPDRFSEADVVLDDLQGRKKVIFNCTTDDSVVCAAHDQRWSPDASKLAFTVAYGAGPDSLYRVKSVVANTPMTREPVEFRAVRYELWIRDMPTGINHLVEEDARMPTWASNTRLGFHSCRAGTFPPAAYHGNDFGKSCSLHLFRGDLTPDWTLTNIKNLTPHATMAMGGYVATTGRWWFSDWWAFNSTRTLPDGSLEPMEKGKGGTPANMFTVDSIEGNGTGHRKELHAHSTPTLYMAKHLPTVDPNRRGVGTSMLRLPRHLDEIPRYNDKGERDGTWMTVSNYYRSNHLGSLGCPYRWTPTEAEGMLVSANIPESEYKHWLPGSGQFTPSDIMCMTPYGTDSDDAHRHDRQGRLMGKAGMQHPTTMGKFTFTHCGGSCYEGTLPMETFEAFTGVGQPTAKKDIRVALVDRVTDPFDRNQSIVIACREQKWNCWDGVERATYQELYGQPEPLPPPPDLGPNLVTVLRVVNIKDGELDKIPAYSANNNNEKVRLQGNADDDWKERIAGIRIKQVIPHREPVTAPGFAEEIHIGDFYAEDDGSLEAVMPCNMTYQLSGIDARGIELAWDLSLHPAVCGEIVTCHGCHVESVERWNSLGAPAVERFADTIAGKKAQ